MSLKCCFKVRCWQDVGGHLVLESDAPALAHRLEEGEAHLGIPHLPDGMVGSLLPGVVVPVPSDHIDVSQGLWCATTSPESVVDDAEGVVPHGCSFRVVHSHMGRCDLGTVDPSGLGCRTPAGATLHAPPVSASWVNNTSSIAHDPYQLLTSSTEGLIALSTTEAHSMNHPYIIPVLLGACLGVGCHRTEPQVQTSVQPWQKATKIESAWHEPGVPVVIRISEAWIMLTSSNPPGYIRIQGQASFSFRGGKPEPTRGLIFSLAPLNDIGMFGDGYLDFDEIPTLLGAIEKFSQDKILLAQRDSYLVGASYKTRSGLFFRTGSSSRGYSLGAHKLSKPDEEIAVSGLTDADLSQLKIIIGSARKWAEAQTP